jgi:hypothetical protein
MLHKLVILGIISMSFMVSLIKLCMDVANV